MVEVAINLQQDEITKAILEELAKTEREDLQDPNEPVHYSYLLLLARIAVDTRNQQEATRLLLQIEAELLEHPQDMTPSDVLEKNRLHIILLIRNRQLQQAIAAAEQLLDAARTMRDLQTMTRVIGLMAWNDDTRPLSDRMQQIARTMVGIENTGFRYQYERLRYIYARLRTRLIEASVKYKRTTEQHRSRQRSTLAPVDQTAFMQAIAHAFAARQQAPHCGSFVSHPW
jgi:hypothetical protein